MAPNDGGIGGEEVTFPASPPTNFALTTNGNPVTVVDGEQVEIPLAVAQAIQTARNA